MSNPALGRSGRKARRLISSGHGLPRVALDGRLPRSRWVQDLRAIDALGIGEQVHPLHTHGALLTPLKTWVTGSEESETDAVYRSAAAGFGGGDGWAALEWVLWDGGGQPGSQPRQPQHRAARP